MRLLSPLGKGGLFRRNQVLTRNTIAGRTEYKVTVVGYHHSNTFIAGLSTAAFGSSIIALQHHSKSQSAWIHPCTLAFLSSFLFHFFFEPSHDSAIVFLFMGKKAMRAVLGACLRISIAPPQALTRYKGQKQKRQLKSFPSLSL